MYHVSSIVRSGFSSCQPHSSPRPETSECPRHFIGSSQVSRFRFSANLRHSHGADICGEQLFVRNGRCGGCAVAHTHKEKENSIKTRHFNVCINLQNLGCNAVVPFPRSFTDDQLCYSSRFMVLWMHLCWTIPAPTPFLRTIRSWSAVQDIWVMKISSVIVFCYTET